MKRGQFFLQDGCGCPTRFAIVSLTLRDGVFMNPRVATGRYINHG